MIELFNDQYLAENKYRFYSYFNNIKMQKILYVQYKTPFLT